MNFLSFVVDLIDVSGLGKNKKSNHYATLILEQPKHQVYWISALDRHEHGQMDPDELKDYIDQLESGSFEKVDINWPNGRWPKKSFPANSVQYSAAKGKYSYGTSQKSARFFAQKRIDSYIGRV